MAELVKGLALLSPSTGGSSDVTSFYAASVRTAVTNSVVASGSVAALSARQAKPIFAQILYLVDGFVHIRKYDDGPSP